MRKVIALEMISTASRIKQVFFLHKFVVVIAAITICFTVGYAPAKKPQDVSTVSQPSTHESSSAQERIRALIFPKVTNAEEVKQATKTTHDPFMKTTLIRGSLMEISIDKFSSYEFRFIVSPNLTPGHFILFVSDLRRSLAFYDRASDIDGNELPTTQHDKRIGNGGQVTEEVYITFPRDYLEQHRQSGLHFKLFGKRDQLEIRVHAFYLDGFLQKVDEYLAKKDEGK